MEEQSNNMGRSSVGPPLHLSSSSSANSSLLSRAHQCSIAADWGECEAESDENSRKGRGAAARDPTTIRTMLTNAAMYYREAAALIGSRSGDAAKVGGTVSSREERDQREGGGGGGQDSWQHFLLLVASSHDVRCEKYQQR